MEVLNRSQQGHINEKVCWCMLGISKMRNLLKILKNKCCRRKIDYQNRFKLIYLFIGITKRNIFWSVLCPFLLYVMSFTLWLCKRAVLKTLIKVIITNIKIQKYLPLLHVPITLLDPQLPQGSKNKHSVVNINNKRLLFSSALHINLLIQLFLLQLTAGLVPEDLIYFSFLVI